MSSEDIIIKVYLSSHFRTFILQYELYYTQPRPTQRSKPLGNKKQENREDDNPPQYRYSKHERPWRNPALRQVFRSSSRILKHLPILRIHITLERERNVDDQEEELTEGYRQRLFFSGAKDDEGYGSFHELEISNARETEGDTKR